MTTEAQKLIDLYIQGKKPLIAVDFDDTIFPFTVDDTRCKVVRELLFEIKGRIDIILFSVADSQSLVYKAYIMEQWGIEPNYINESPIKHWGDSVKPYYNLLLDDKAGLNEAIQILTEFKDNYLNINNII